MRYLMIRCARTGEIRTEQVEDGDPRLDLVGADGVYDEAANEGGERQGGSTVGETTDPNAQGFTLEEQLARFETNLQERLDSDRATTLEAVNASLERATQPNRERVLDRPASAPARAPQQSEAGDQVPTARQGPGLAQRQYQHRGRISTFDARDYLYRRLDPEAREIRNPQTDVYMRDWLRAIAKPSDSPITPAQARARIDEHFGLTRADYEVFPVDPNSGYSTGGVGPFVPLPLATLITLARDKANRSRSRVTTFQATATTLRAPISGVASAAMVSEGATKTKENPTLTDKLFSLKKAQAHFDSTIEALSDSAFNLVTFFSERAGSALGALEDVQVATSNGTAPNITESLESASITAVDALVGALAYTDVVKLLFGVPSQYQATGTFSGNQKMLAELSLVLDGNGRPIFTAGLATPGVVSDVLPGQVGTMFGRPVIEMPHTDGELFYGDYRQYGFLDGGSMQIRASEHAGWDQDEIRWKVTERFDGLVLLEDAFRKLQGITLS